MTKGKNPNNTQGAKKCSSSQLVTAEEFKSCFLQVLESDEVLQTIIDKLNNQLSMVIDEKIQKIEHSLTSQIKEQNEKMASLQATMDTLLNTNKTLEEKINRFEQESLQNTLLLSGHNFAETVAERTNPNFIPDLSKIVQFFLREVGVDVSPNDIQHIRRISRKGSNVPTLQVSFRNMVSRNSIYKARFKLKGKNIYLNEMLTPVNAKYMFEARKLKKDKKIDDCFTLNGIPTIKTAGKIVHIRSQCDLNKFH